MMYRGGSTVQYSTCTHCIVLCKYSICTVRTLCMPNFYLLAKLTSEADEASIHAHMYFSHYFFTGKKSNI